MWSGLATELQTAAPSGLSSNIQYTLDNAPSEQRASSKQTEGNIPDSAANCSCKLPSGLESISKTRRRKGSQEKPKRPPNAFILYRSAMLREPCVKEHEANLPPDHAIKTNLSNQQILSKRIAERWKKESTAVKEHYYAVSAAIASEHRIKYPDYKYQPKRRSTTDVEVAPFETSTSGRSDKSKRRLSADEARAKALPYPSVSERRASTGFGLTCSPGDAHLKSSSGSISPARRTLTRTQSSRCSDKAKSSHRRTGSVDAVVATGTPTEFQTLLASDNETLNCLPVGVAFSTREASDSSANCTRAEDDAPGARRGLQPALRQRLEASLQARIAATSTGGSDMLQTPLQSQENTLHIVQTQPTASAHSHWSETNIQSAQNSRGSLQQRQIEANGVWKLESTTRRHAPTSLDHACPPSVYSMQRPQISPCLVDQTDSNNLDNWNLPQPAWAAQYDWPLQASLTDAVASTSAFDRFEFDSPKCGVESLSYDLIGLDEPVDAASRFSYKRTSLFDTTRNQNSQQDSDEEHNLHQRTEDMIKQALSQDFDFQSIATPVSTFFPQGYGLDQQPLVSVPTSNTRMDIDCPNGCTSQSLQVFEEFIDPRLCQTMHTPAEASAPDSMPPAASTSVLSPTFFTNFSRPFEHVRVLGYDPLPDSLTGLESSNEQMVLTSPTKHSSLMDWKSFPSGTIKNLLRKETK